MPHYIKPPKTLKERYGTQQAYFLATREKHNNLTYKDFLFRINPNRKHKIPVTVAAEDFNVTTPTWYSWLEWYKDEHSTDQQEEGSHLLELAE